MGRWASSRACRCKRSVHRLTRRAGPLLRRRGESVLRKEATGSLIGTPFFIDGEPADQPPRRTAARPAAMAERGNRADSSATTLGGDGASARGAGAGLVDLAIHAALPARAATATQARATATTRPRRQRAGDFAGPAGGDPGIRLGMCSGEYGDGRSSGDTRPNPYVLPVASRIARSASRAFRGTDPFLRRARGPQRFIAPDGAHPQRGDDEMRALATSGQSPYHSDVARGRPVRASVPAHSPRHTGLRA